MSDIQGTAQAYEQFGRAIQGFGTQISDKLYNAEATAQYLSAFDKMRQGMSNFDNQIRTDPNWQQYGQKAQESDQKIFDSILPTLKNQAAKNQFIQAFAQERAAHYNTVLNYANTRRIGDLVGQARGSVMGVVPEAQKGNFDAKSMQTALTTLKAANDIGAQVAGYEQAIINDEVIRQTAALYTGKVEQGAWDVLAKSRDIQQAMNYIDQKGRAYNLSNTQIRSAQDAIKSIYASEQAKMTAQINAADEKTYLDDLSAIDSGKFNFGAFISAQGNFKGSKAATYYKNTADYYRMVMKNAADPANAVKISQPQVYNDLSAMADATDRSQADKISQITQSAVDGKLSQSDYTKLKDRARAVTNSAFTNVASDLKKYTSSTAQPGGAKAPWTSSEEKQAQDMLSELKTRSNLENWIPSQILAEGAKITSVINDKALQRSVNDHFKGESGFLGFHSFLGMAAAPSPESEISGFLQSFAQGELSGLTSSAFVLGAWRDIQKQLADELQKQYGVSASGAAMALHNDGTVTIQIPGGAAYRVVATNGKLEFQRGQKQ